MTCADEVFGKRRVTFPEEAGWGSGAQVRPGGLGAQPLGVVPAATGA
jgi:hypothetical protein